MTVSRWFKYLIVFINYLYILFLTESQEQLMDVYERLDDICADTAEARAANILHGLGFSKAMQNQKTKDFSGNKML